MKRVIIPADQDGVRLDVALAAHLKVSRSQVQRQIKAGLITDEAGEWVESSRNARAGEAFRVAESPTIHTPEAPTLAILYEDNDLIVVDKPAGLVVHTTASQRPQPTVAAFAVAHGVIDDDPERPGIVHRLDKDTSGAMVIAKNPEAKRALQQQFKKRTVEKTYVALVRGRLPQPQAVIRLPLGRHHRHTAKRAVVPGAREAATEYRELRAYPGATLVEVDLHTGRTHQIRVHFSHIGHPVIGDTMYGDPRRPAGLSRQFLHASRLELMSPSHGRVSVESPLPADLRQYLHKLERSSG